MGIAAFCLAMLLAAALVIGQPRRRTIRRLRARLHDQRERLDKLLAAVQDAIIMIDERGAISMWNPAARRMFGYSAGEAIGQNLHELIAPKRYHEAHLRGFAAFQRSGEGAAIGRVLELVGLRKNGEEFPIELTVSALRSDGGWQAVGIIRDITQRKQIERQQELYAAALEGQRQAMEQLYGAAEVANRAKSEFLANMSHEIRTPMTAILGYAELLAESLDKPEQLDAVQIIRRNGEHLLAIINDILDLSKLEAGKMQVERRAVAPLEIVEDVISLLRVRAEGKRLKLRLVIDGPIPKTIQTDATRLRQILLNLVGNAIKFTELGEVRVTLRLADGGPHGRQLAFEVADTGIGMTPEQLKNLFRPFQQADASTSRKYGGTGLGLAISKRLAEMLGGDILATSRLGEGSTFVVTIDPGPLADAEGVLPAESRLVPSSSRPEEQDALPQLRCRVLLAEDGPDNQRIISFFLTKAGASVTVVDNGRKAVEMALGADRSGEANPAEGPPFDVILMDMQMPVMDGYEATRRLRARGYNGPIIALTAHAMAHDRRKCLDAGCDDYAAKPIDRNELVRLVAEHAARSAAAPAAPSTLPPFPLPGEAPAHA